MTADHDERKAGKDARGPRLPSPLSRASGGGAGGGGQTDERLCRHTNLRHRPRQGGQGCPRTTSPLSRRSGGGAGGGGQTDERPCRHTNLRHRPRQGGQGCPRTTTPHSRAATAPATWTSLRPGPRASRPLGDSRVVKSSGRRDGQKGGAGRNMPRGTRCLPWSVEQNRGNGPARARALPVERVPTRSAVPDRSAFPLPPPKGGQRCPRTTLPSPAPAGEGQGVGAKPTTTTERRARMPADHVSPLPRQRGKGRGWGPDGRTPVPAHQLAAPPSPRRARMPADHDSPLQ